MNIFKKLFKKNKTTNTSDDFFEPTKDAIIENQLNEFELNSFVSTPIDNGFEEINNNEILSETSVGSSQSHQVIIINKINDYLQNLKTQTSLNFENFSSLNFLDILNELEIFFSDYEEAYFDEIITQIKKTKEFYLNLKKTVDSLIIQENKLSEEIVLFTDEVERIKIAGKATFNEQLPVLQELQKKLSDKKNQYLEYEKNINSKINEFIKYIPSFLQEIINEINKK